MERYLLSPTFSFTFGALLTGLGEVFCLLHDHVWGVGQQLSSGEWNCYFLHICYFPGTLHKTFHSLLTIPLSSHYCASQCGKCSSHTTWGLTVCKWELGSEPAATDSQSSALCCAPESPCRLSLLLRGKVSLCIWCRVDWVPREPSRPFGEGSQGPSAGWWSPSAVFGLSPTQINCSLPEVGCFLVSLFRPTWEWWGGSSQADRELIPTQLAACTAPSLESDSSASSGTAIQAQLLSWHLWAPSGVTGPPLRAWGLGVLCASGILSLGWWKPCLTESFTVRELWRKPETEVQVLPRSKGSLSNIAPAFPLSAPKKG